MSEELSLRDVISDNWDKAESGTLERAPDAPEIQDSEIKSDNEITKSDDKPRDDKGRFAPTKEEKISASLEKTAVEPAQVSPGVEPTNNIPLARPTTWKKEYLPLWEKMAQGQSLSPEEAHKLAEYSNQREHEYSTGVSTYKQMADEAKQLRDAIAPFAAHMQAAGASPAQVMTNLGNAHMVLTRGSPEQKLQAFAKLAQDYGVPLDAVPQAMQGQYDPNAMQLMQMQQQVQSVQHWQQQQEQQILQRELAIFEDKQKYPYFNDVRMDMAQLLESGVAKDLDSAYNKAVRLNDNVFEAQQANNAQNKAAQTRDQAIEAAKTAKSRVVSTKSSSPIGQQSTGSPSENRKAMLEEQWDRKMNSRI